VKIREDFSTVIARKDSRVAVGVGTIRFVAASMLSMKLQTRHVNVHLSAIGTRKSGIFTSSADVSLMDFEMLVDSPTIFAPSFVP